MSDIDKLLADIEGGLPGVTPGPWRPFVKNDVVALMKGRGPHREIIKWTGFDGSDYRKAAAKNCRHIARCSPDNIRALLSHIRAQEEALAEAREVIEPLLKRRQERAEILHKLVQEAREEIRTNLEPNSPQWMRRAFAGLQDAHHVIGGDPFDMDIRAALARALAARPETPAPPMNRQKP